MDTKNKRKDSKDNSTNYSIKKYHSTSDNTDKKETGKEGRIDWY